MQWNVGAPLYPAQRYLRRFRRPDLVQKALRGDRITAPALTNEDIPPTAHFVGLKEGEWASGNAATVTVEVQDNRPVKDVELLVNGRPLPPAQARPITADVRAITA